MQENCNIRDKTFERKETLSDNKQFAIDMYT